MIFIIIESGMDKPPKIQIKPKQSYIIHADHLYQ